MMAFAPEESIAHADLSDFRRIRYTRRAGGGRAAENGQQAAPCVK
jgi:hypothetical protein